MRWRIQRLGQVLVAAGVAAAYVGFSMVVGLNIVVAMVLVAAVLIVAVFAQVMRERRADKQHSTSAFLVYNLVVAVVVAAGIRLVPARRIHSNPPVTGEPQWANHWPAS